MIRFASPLLAGRLVRRYKRFLADVRLEESGEVVTAHTANPGRMQGLAEPGYRVWLSHQPSPRRKLAYTWELVEVEKTFVHVNPVRASQQVIEALGREAIAELSGYPELRPEVTVRPAERRRRKGRNVRLDLLLSRGAARCFVEVKSATLLEDGRALFPDAPSERGRDHLGALRDLRTRMGHRAACLFVVQRGDAKRFAPADAIDPEYGRLLRAAARDGVELLAYQARIHRDGIVLAKQLPVDLG